MNYLKVLALMLFPFLLNGQQITKFYVEVDLLQNRNSSPYANLHNPYFGKNSETFNAQFLNSAELGMDDKSGNRYYFKISSIYFTEKESTRYTGLQSTTKGVEVSIAALHNFIDYKRFQMLLGPELFAERIRYEGTEFDDTPPFQSEFNSLGNFVGLAGIIKCDYEITDNLSVTYDFRIRTGYQTFRNTGATEQGEASWENDYMIVNSIGLRYVFP